MEITLYFYDPVSRRPTGKQETVSLSGDVQVYSMSMESVWKALGKKGACTATYWKPPTNNCVYDGHGWVELEGMDAATAVHLIGLGAISVDDVFLLKLEDLVFDEMQLLVRGALTTYSNRLDADYPAFEKESWEMQKEEALEVLKNNSAEAPILRSIAEVEGKSVTRVAEQVLQKEKDRNKALKDFAVLSNKARAKVKEAQHLYKEDKKQALLLLSSLLEQEMFKLS